MDINWTDFDRCGGKPVSNSRHMQKRSNHLPTLPILESLETRDIHGGDESPSGHLSVLPWRVLWLPLGSGPLATP